MKRIQSVRLLLLIVIGVLITFFNNCTEGGLEGFSTVEESSIIDPPPDIELGRKLYAVNCAMCHQPIDSSTKKDVTAVEIKLAIEQVLVMRTIEKLKALSERDLQLIELALKIPAEPSDLEKGRLLYANHCASCHSPIETSTKIGSKANEIKLSISSITEMKSIVSLKSLSDADLQLIELALKPAIEPPDLDKGKILYAAQCASCHQPIEASTKKGRTFVEIKAAIGAIDEMKTRSGLIGLSDESIQLIELALKLPTDPPPPPAAGKVTDVTPMVGSRYILSSHLMEVFATDYVFTVGGQITGKSINTTIANIIKANVLDKPEAFGGNCGRHDPGCMPASCAGKFSEPQCIGILETRITAAHLPIRNSMSKGYLNKACEEMLNLDQAVTISLENARVYTTGEAVPKPEVSHILTFINYYNNERPVLAGTAAEMEKVALDAKSKGMSNLDQWRFVLLPICSSMGEFL